MTKEARSLTIFCCISSVFLLGIIIWGIGSIKDGRKKLSRIDLEQRQSEYGQKKTDEIPKKIVEKVSLKEVETQGKLPTPIKPQKQDVSLYEIIQVHKDSRGGIITHVYVYTTSRTKESFLSIGKDGGN